MCKKGGKLSSFLTSKNSCEHPSFMLEWDHCHCQENVMKNTSDT